MNDLDARSTTFSGISRSPRWPTSRLGRRASVAADDGSFSGLATPAREKLSKGTSALRRIFPP